MFVWGDSVKSDLVAVIVPEPEPFIKAAIEHKLVPANTQIPMLGVVTPELEQLCKNPGPLKDLVMEDIARLGKERKVGSYQTLITISSKQQSIDCFAKTKILQIMGYEFPKAISFVPEAMTMQNGMLTPTNKVKRDGVIKNWRPIVDELYKIVDSMPRDSKGRPKL